MTVAGASGAPVLRCCVPEGVGSGLLPTIALQLPRCWPRFRSPYDLGAAARDWSIGMKPTLERITNAAVVVSASS
jgi:hypothetical protein